MLSMDKRTSLLRKSANYCPKKVLWDWPLCYLVLPHFTLPCQAYRPAQAQPRRIFPNLIWPNSPDLVFTYLCLSCLTSSLLTQPTVPPSLSLPSLSSPCPTVPQSASPCYALLHLALPVISNDLYNIRNNNKTRHSISGSSFTGELLSAMPNVSYFFEPLWFFGNTPNNSRSQCYKTFLFVIYKVLLNQSVCLW